MQHGFPNKAKLSLNKKFWYDCDQSYATSQSNKTKTTCSWRSQVNLWPVWICSDDKKPFYRTQKGPAWGVTFYCDQCAYKSSCRSMLVGHVKSVHKGMKYNCYQCDYTAIQNWLPIRHKQHVHEEMKCEKCECKTVAKKNLVRHKRYEHEGIQHRSIKFVCNQCSIPLLLHGYKYFINALSMITRQLSRFILFNTSTTLNFEVMNWHFWKKKIRRTNFLTRDQLNQLRVPTARQEKMLSTPTSNFWKCAQGAVSPRVDVGHFCHLKPIPMSLKLNSQ